MGCDSNTQRKRAKEEEEGPGLMGSHSLVGFCCCYFLFLVFFSFFFSGFLSFAIKSGLKETPFTLVLLEFLQHQSLLPAPFPRKGHVKNRETLSHLFKYDA